MHAQIAELEQQLDNFDFNTRSSALARLLALAEKGEITLPDAANIVNMHCHTFFSFNAYGYSPTHLAWVARQKAFRAIGSVDFDVLDAVDEFLNANDEAGVRASAGLESRVFIPEFSTREINSPGEPGIYYYMGIGFTSSRVPARAAPILASMRARAAQRNREMVRRVNAYLDPVAIDYERDVIPLTPSGNPTERHLLVAYVRAAERIAAAEKIAPDVVGFWAGKLNMSHEEIAGLIADAPKFQNVLRMKLMKRGGVGYITPTPESFPSVNDLNQATLACGALPCAAWLDGTTAGEKDIQELTDLLVSKGAVALNIIPDRNWNLPDPEVKRVKVQNLYDIVALAQQMDLPLNVGTEMNTFGNKLVDDFDAPELAPVHQAFLDGAHFIFGHTILQRALGLGYQSAWARAHLPTRRERNAFYTELGYAVPPGRVSLERLNKLDDSLTPNALLKQVK